MSVGDPPWRPEVAVFASLEVALLFENLKKHHRKRENRYFYLRLSPPLSRCAHLDPFYPSVVYSEDG